MARKNTIKKNIDDNYIDDIKPQKKSKTKDKTESNNFISKIVAFLQNDRVHQAFGVFLLSFSVFLFISLASYLFYWQADDVLIDNSTKSILFDSTVKVQNWMGKFGSLFGYFFIKKGFGITAFAFLLLFFQIGLKLTFDYKPFSILKSTLYSVFFIIWGSTLLGFLFLHSIYTILGGAFGVQMSIWLISIIGQIGTVILLLATFLIFGIIEFNLSFKGMLKKNSNATSKASKIENEEEDEMDEELDAYDNDDQDEEDEEEDGMFQFEVKTIEKKDTKKTPEIAFETRNEPIVTSLDDPSLNNGFEQNGEEKITLNTITESKTTDKSSENDFEIIIPEEETIVEIDSVESTTHYGLDTEYDPRLELSSYQFPSIDLMVDYANEQDNNTEAKKEELHANKDRIIETLKNYSIQIDKIFATVGPTVTLYEIVPAPGVRISKIKNLEDDIALSLAALGIRIIAPIPGKGTIGIEVPNSKPEIVPMRSILASEKFVNSKFDLPIGLGKTISNETFIYDLAKMPHLLMAGATGQGKSVGLNAIIASLLYKKHPAELKFVMVDPKKVELTLFSKIERHFLAKLPDSEEAIITDTKKVVRTVNSLCIEMDNRYDLLKDAQCRNIKEYNQKFINRKLNPEHGHRYLPYIVLIVDEFADLIMTAGKEVEMPIARLAQLARAIGIHLIIATQRPSVNIITGTIKANFPARIAFRVTSKIDSRTILDSSGAEQLIGRGDMLLSTGNDLIRLQCAFVDTPEVEDVTEFIGSQRAYPSALYLPEVPDDEADGVPDFDPDDRDSMFVEAARVLVQNQHGSTSLLQRKLKLGYNRAGRIIDQLEAVGIVGPFEGSKAREVKIKTEMELDEFLRNNNLV